MTTRETRADDLPDAGMIDGLPAGWIAAKIAAIRVSRHLEKLIDVSDMATWRPEPNAQKSVQMFSGTETEARLLLKLNEHVPAVFQRAFLSGILSASLYDGQSFRSLPKAAFLDLDRLQQALISESFTIDPLWPDEWWPWNRKDWAVPKAQFEAWLASSEPAALDGLPPATEIPIDAMITRIAQRAPTDRARIPLSEAASWIAFGLALQADRLDQTLRLSLLPQGELKKDQQKLIEAIRELTAAGSDGKLAFFGRYMQSPNDTGATSASIEQVRLDDYRAFRIDRDELHYGDGLHRVYDKPYSFQCINSERKDYFTQVTVNRAELISCFGGTAGRTMLRKFSDAERKQWIDEQPMMKADEAYRLYKKHPRFCGTKVLEFREEWKEVKRTRRGRPPGIKSTNK